MQQPDWSQAPVGTTHYAKYGLVSWYKWDEANRTMYYYSSSGAWEFSRGFVNKEITFHDLIAKPEPWCGGSLPPIGIVCRVVLPAGAGHPLLDNFNNREVEIIAHTTTTSREPLAVFKVQGFVERGSPLYHALVAGCFQPLKTEEELRKETIISEVKEILGDVSASPEVLEKLYNYYK